MLSDIRHNGRMSRFTTHLAAATLLLIAVGAIVAVFAAPGDASSKTALGLGAAAALFAAANFATNPDWDQLVGDVRRLRDLAERRAIDSPRDVSKHPNRPRCRWRIVLALGIVWACDTLARKRR
jgi:hypothetical protein